MKVMLTGANGQLGWEMQRTKPAEIELRALDSQDLDIRDREAVHEIVTRFAPVVIVNAAAYTDVDKAESEKDLAFAVNCQGAKNLAEVAKEVGAFMVQVSTDYVFDGKNSTPYLASDEPSALSVYGASKLAGEKEVFSILGQECAVLRSSWLYSFHGNNFVKTMLRLFEERDQLGVVDDQVGTPTWANGLAESLWLVCKKRINGILHWSDAGVASWYDLSVAVLEEAKGLGIVKKDIMITPIGSAEYQTLATRPSYSVLDKRETWKKLEMQADHWRLALRKMLLDYKDSLGA